MTDITYVQTGEDWLYLAGVKDQDLDRVRAQPSTVDIRLFLFDILVRDRRGISIPALFNSARQNVECEDQCPDRPVWLQVGARQSGLTKGGLVLQDEIGLIYFDAGRVILLAGVIIMKNPAGGPT